MATEFFVPGNDPESGEEMYLWIVRYVKEVMGIEIEPIRIFSLTYAIQGQVFSATVGEQDPRTGQIVLAILRSEEYLICTPYYGVRRGEPIRIARSEVQKVDYFRGLDNSQEQLRSIVTALYDRRSPLGLRLHSAGKALLETMDMDDFPATIAVSYLSLTYRLTWKGALDTTIAQIDDREMGEIATEIKNLYVDVLSLSNHE